MSYHLLSIIVYQRCSLIHLCLRKGDSHAALAGPADFGCLDFQAESVFFLVHIAAAVVVAAAAPAAVAVAIVVNLFAVVVLVIVIVATAIAFLQPLPCSFGEYSLLA